MPDAKIYNKCKSTTLHLFYDILVAFRNGSTLKVKSLFYSILSELDSEENRYKVNSSFSNVLKYINENISNADINVNTLAEHFRHKFCKEFNISPKQYTLISRLNSAKELLLNSNLSVADIAKQTGFADSNYFSRYFKRITGYSPTQFKINGKKFL